MQVKVRWSVSLAEESSRLEFAAKLTRPLYSSVAVIETFWFAFLTSRSPPSWRAEHKALIIFFSTSVTLWHWLPVQIKAHSVLDHTLSVHTVSYGGTDARSNARPLHSDWAWFRHDKWVSDGCHDCESIDLCCDLHISI